MTVTEPGKVQEKHINRSNISVFDEPGADQAWKSKDVEPWHFADLYDLYNYPPADVEVCVLSELTFEALVDIDAGILNHGGDESFEPVAKHFPDKRVRTCLIKENGGWMTGALYVKLDDTNQRNKVADKLNEGGIKLRPGSDSNTGWYYFEME